MKRFRTTKGFIPYAILLIAFLFLFQNLAVAGGPQTLCQNFVEQKLQKEGGVFTNYLPAEGNGDLAAGHCVLSESQGLMLAYYVHTGSKDMAAKTIAFVQNHLDTGSILSYLLDENKQPYPVNAAVDDLRLIGAMLSAADAFAQQDYREQAVSYARRLYGTNVRSQTLADFYDLQYEQAGGYATLCYSDFSAMNAISAYDDRWIPVAENMRNLVLGGYLGDAFPFFQTRYNMDTQSYESENVPMVESLLTAYHLSNISSCPKQTLAYLKKTLESGKLYSLYDFSGNPRSDAESTAIYALCALIGAGQNDAELYHDAIRHMLPFQVMDVSSPVYGAFADAQTLKTYSFDNLMALLALEAGKVF
jgi:hypothetical protein